MQVRKNNDYVTNLLLATMMGLSFSYALSASLFKGSSLLTMAIYVFAAVIIYSVILRNRHTLLITGIAAGAAVMVAVVYVLREKLFHELIYSINLYILWLIEFMQTGTRYIRSYEITTTVLISVSTALFIYIFTYKKFSFPVLLAAGAALFCIQWAMGFFVSYFSFYLFVFLIVLYYFKHIYMKSISNAEGEFVSPTVFILGIVPVCALILAVGLSIPANSKPIEWKWLDTKINEFYNNLNRKIHYQAFEYFSVASTGFGEGYSRLGGRVRLDKTTVLTVNSPKHTYLKGSVRDIYTGSSWLNSDEEFVPFKEAQIDYYFDSFELENGLKLLTGSDELTNELVKKDKISVTFEYLKTKSFFTPIKTSAIYPPASKNAPSILLDDNGILTADKVIGRSFNYSLDVLSVQYGNEELVDALKRSKKGLYNELSSNASRRNRRVVRLRGTQIELETLEKLRENSDKVYAKYLQLPEELPDRVKELANAITTSAGTDYDKVKAVEQYLASNYPYTLNTRTVPKNRDFVDYFLFTEKQGYCTYYATAMTVLLRSIGIPSRYVEGYILPPKPSTGTTYKVTNEQAHAWVEVYFEGFGWMPFEPTSPFRSAFYNSTSPDTGALISGEFASDPYYLEYMRRLDEYRMRRMEAGLDPSLEGMTAEKASNLKYILIAVFSALLILVFLFTIFFNFLKNKVALYTIKKMAPRESILAMVDRYFNILSVQDQGMRPGETPLEYGMRVGDTFMVDHYQYKDGNSPFIQKSGNTYTFTRKKSRFSDVMDLFTLAKYSRKDITEENKQFVFNYYGSIIKKTRSNLGKTRFFLYRYILGKV